MNFPQAFSQLGLDAKSPRRTAMERFNQIGLPTRKDENWKYIDPAKWLAPQYQLPTENKLNLVLHNDFAAYVVIHNGRFRRDMSNLDSLPAGVRVHAVRGGMAGDVQDKDGFFFLNSAFSNERLVIEVDAGAKVEQPLEVVHVTEDSMHSASQISLRLGARSTLKMVERFVSAGLAHSFSNRRIDAVVNESAELTLCQIQEENERTFNINHVEATVATKSQFQIVTLSLGGGFARHNIHCQLAGTLARTSLHHLYLLKDEQNADFCTLVEHQEPSTFSHQLARGILSGKSKGVFNGTVKMERKALQSEAVQLNRNLMLDDRAEVYTRPQLRIDADDVKASHGATVGQIDDEELFYLQSRGIGRAESVKMLAAGFAETVFSNLPDVTIKKVLQEKTRAKLEFMDVGSII